MAYDEDLADRLRLLLAERNLNEKKMSGGLASLIALDDDPVLQVWVERGLAYACSPPPKENAPVRRRAADRGVREATTSRRSGPAS